MASRRLLLHPFVGDAIAHPNISYAGEPFEPITREGLHDFSTRLKLTGIEPSARMVYWRSPSGLRFFFNSWVRVLSEGEELFLFLGLSIKNPEVGKWQLISSDDNTLIVNRTVSPLQPLAPAPTTDLPAFIAPQTSQPGKLYPPDGYAFDTFENADIYSFNGTSFVPVGISPIIVDTFYASTGSSTYLRIITEGVYTDGSPWQLVMDRDFRNPVAPSPTLTPPVEVLTGREYQATITPPEGYAIATAAPLEIKRLGGGTIAQAVWSNGNYQFVVPEAGIISLIASGTYTSGDRWETDVPISVGAMPRAEITGNLNGFTHPPLEIIQVGVSVPDFRAAPDFERISVQWRLTGTTDWRTFNGGAGGMSVSVGVPEPVGRYDLKVLVYYSLTPLVDELDGFFIVDGAAGDVQASSFDVPETVTAGETVTPIQTIGNPDTVENVEFTVTE